MELPLAIPSYINLPKKSRPFFPELKWVDIEKMHRISDISALYTAAKAGLSASFSFTHIIEKDLSDGSLIDITPIKTMPSLPVFLMYQPCSYMPKKQRAYHMIHIKKRFLRSHRLGLHIGSLIESISSL